MVATVISEIDKILKHVEECFWLCTDLNKVQYPIILRLNNDFAVRFVSYVVCCTCYR